MTAARRAFEALVWALLANMVLPLSEADQATREALELRRRVK